MRAFGRAVLSFVCLKYFSCVHVWFLFCLFFSFFPPTMYVFVFYFGRAAKSLFNILLYRESYFDAICNLAREPIYLFFLIQTILCVCVCGRLNSFVSHEFTASVECQDCQAIFILFSFLFCFSACMMNASFFLLSFKLHCNKI